MNAATDGRNTSRPFPLRLHHSQHGVALVAVLAVLAITTILVVAFFSIARIELSSSKTYADGIRARQLSETAVNIAISQFKKATIAPDDDSSPYYAWASQPGAIRKYDHKGNFFKGYKLYSSGDMVIDADEGEQVLVEDAPPADWKNKPGHYTDLNEPSIRRNTDGDIQHIYFPIIDPRASLDMDGQAPVKGFSFSQTYQDGTVDPNVITDGAADELRIPMPVEWLYVLQDGSVGPLDQSGKFVPAKGGQPASVENPIVGRIAFWADDETSKVNINTASEPTFWHYPIARSNVDIRHALYQPSRGEFQRYPGHPATVALSPVLFPDLYKGIDDMARPDDAPDLLVDRKKLIYDLVPRINNGGSEAGTVRVTDYTPIGKPFAPYEALAVEPDGDRLYASLDELIFEDPEEGTPPPRNGNPLVSPELIERARFFLTTHSRAPETNIFNFPRIAVWPISAQTNPRYFSTFDKLIAFCATVGGTPFYFKRADADHPTNDYEDIVDNQLLFDSRQAGYLWNLGQLGIPGYGGSLADKYGDDELHQIMTEVFDYIRCINLHDDLLAPEHGYPNRPSEFYTFTDGRSNRRNEFRGDDAELVHYYPGHGQVTPINIENRSGGTSRGMGRMHTFSEVALQFICSAEGADWVSGADDPFVEIDYDGKKYYANIPPNPQSDPAYSRLSAEQKKIADNPANWNHMLPEGKHLRSGRKLVQACIHIETFCPSMGWTQIAGDVHCGLRDLDQLVLEGQQLFRPAPASHDGYQIAAGGDFSDGPNWGGPNGIRGFLRGSKHTWSAASPDGDVRVQEDPEWRRNRPRRNRLFPLTSYVIETDANTMDFQGSGKPIRIEFYLGRNPGSSTYEYTGAFQSIEVEFPDATFKTPDLIKRGTPQTINRNTNRISARPTAPPYWWCFNREGCYGSNVTSRRTRDTDELASKGGRLLHATNNIRPFLNRDNEEVRSPYAGNFLRSEDTIQSIVPWHGDYRHVLGAGIIKENDALFRPHKLYGKNRHAHNLMIGQDTRRSPGFAYSDKPILQNARYEIGGYPDWPVSQEEDRASDLISNSFDFDNGPASATDGPYINKPDEGDTRIRFEASIPYMTNYNENESPGPTYFSPNRIMPGPGMFGSLPTGIKGTPGVDGGRSTPWRTLLLRPQNDHFGAAHEPSRNLPPDHILLDFFWMPKVEPYAISEPFSTAGKINLNYQILPFTNINRATGIHAVLQSERLTTLPLADTIITKRWPNRREGGIGNGNPREGVFPIGWDNAKKEWWRTIDVEQTRRQFEDQTYGKFGKGEVFKSPSELCEIHLVPDGAELSPSSSGWELKKGSNDFWTGSSLHSGDNSRERPYTNRIENLTTKSNTFNVHLKAQAITKSPTTPPDTFVEDRDTITSEYRGSTMIERYIDPNDQAFQERDYRYFRQNDLEPLDDFYRYRILSHRRFAP
ncbi:MAG: Verru_Chthon cassette protein A [Verrucomicrobiota bacterium]